MSFCVNEPRQMYKVCTVTELNIDLPEYQRLLCKERVQEIYESFLPDIEQGRFPLLPGCLVVCKTEDKQWLVDGNHRYSALKRLYAEKKIDLRVCINEITVDDEKEAILVFDRVNKSMPVPEMPAGLNLSLPNKVVKPLKEKYSGLFTSKNKPNRPFISERVFTEQVGLILVETGLSPNEVLLRILAYNAKCSRFLPSAFGTGHNKGSNKMKEKCEAHGGFYLGMFKNYEWVHTVFKIGQNDPISDKKHRQNIPDKIRQDVWSHFIGPPNLRVICPICTDEILTYRNWVAGHILPVCKGGENTLDNLRPICSACNLSMGTKIMTGVEDFEYVEA